MFINNKIKRLVISCLSIAAVSTICAGAASTDTKKDIDEVVAQMNTYKSYMTYAHSHAESVRATGADDDHEVIQSAKVLWEDANENYQELVKQYNSLTAQYKIEVAAEEAAKKKAEEEKKKQEQGNRVLLGKWKITAYTSSPSENGGSTLTATGKRLAGNEWSIIAIDPSYWRYGTKFYIEGVGVVTAEDCGGAIKSANRADLLVPIGQADSWGVQYRNVYLVK